MTVLPNLFLKWNYYPRRRALRELVNGDPIKNMDRFFLESTRHNPALCTAFQENHGQVLVNAKIVGAGYVVKMKHMNAALTELQDHFEYWEKLFAKKQSRTMLEKNLVEYRKKGASLLLRHLYFDDPQTAKDHVDFGKMSTIELALSKPHSSKHTWQAVQHNRISCLLFYQPPSISYEVRGEIEIHEDDLYCDFVNLVHDAFHYAYSKSVRRNKPVYIFKVKEVFDNGPAPKQFGKKIV